MWRFAVCIFRHEAAWLLNETTVLRYLLLYVRNYHTLQGWLGHVGHAFVDETLPGCLSTTFSSHLQEEEGVLSITTWNAAWESFG